MAKNNRDEAIVEVESVLVPTLTLTQHKTLLNEKILNSTVFEKDVIASETPVAGTVTIDYEDKDTATVTTAVDLAVSFTNLENGAIKYLEVTKAAANVISLVGAVDAVNYKEYINSVLTSVCYRISNKNGVIYIEAVPELSNNSFASLTLLTGWTGTVKWRFNEFTRKVEVDFNVTFTGTPISNPIVNLLAGMTPDRNVFFDLYKVSDASRISAYVDYTIGKIYPIGHVNGGVYMGYVEYYKTLP
jgi:hypothetical protein